MKKLWSVAGALVSAILFVAPSGARTEAPSGDTCTANGNGTAYTVSIMLPSGAVEQGAFAFGAPGATVTGIKIAGNPGTYSTQNLPPNTTATWLLTNPPSAPGGSQVSAAVTMNHTISGSITAVPATANTNGQPVTYFDPISCPIDKGSPIPNTKFSVQAHFTYSAGTWHFFVTVPGKGKIFIEAKSSPKPLLAHRTIQVNGAGKVKAMIGPTTAGKAMLKSTGSIKAKLIVQFKPQNGRPATKTVSVTLRK